MVHIIIESLGHGATTTYVWGRCGVSPPEGVAAYCPKVEACRDTSPHSDNSRVGGDIPHQKSQ